MRSTLLGFSLIEMMIVVAIVGIMAAVAFPQYVDYTVNARVASIFTAADPIRKSVALCYAENGGNLSVCSNGQSGIAPAAISGFSKEVLQQTVLDGIIVLVLQGVGAGVNGKSVTFTPVPDGTQLGWCVSTDINAAEGKAAAIAKQSLLKNNGSGCS